MAVQPGIKGFDAPPFSISIDELPALDGGAFRWSRATTRELFLPLMLWAPDRASLVLLKRRLLNQFNPKLGPGTLKVTETDARGNQSSRSIDCYYISGMEGDEEGGDGFTYCRYGVVLHAPDPFWYGDTVTPPVLPLGSAPPINFFTGKNRGDPQEQTGPFLPGMHLSVNAYVPPAGLSLNNPGDMEAWPVWTLVATNAVSVTLTNLTTGKSLVLYYNFAGPADPVTIDTRPGHKTVTNSGNVNLWSSLGANPQLWPLVGGNNQIQISFGAQGTSQVTATASCAFMPRYVGV